MLKNQMIRAAAGLMLLASLASSADAIPVTPVDGKIDGIGAAQFLATMQPLGEWRTPAAYTIKLFQEMSRQGGECGVSDRDDSDFCPRFALFLSVNGETAEPVDFALYRLPESLGWKVPKGAEAKIGNTDFVLPLSSCEMTKTQTGYGWQGVSYRLHVSMNLVDGPEGAHSTYQVDRTKLPGSRPDCVN